MERERHRDLVDDLMPHGEDAGKLPLANYPSGKRTFVEQTKGPT